MIAERPKLGLGMYTLNEAAAYARVNRRRMQSWMFGTDTCEAVIDPQHADGETIGFLDFVQTLAIREIRRQRSVSIQKIRKAILYAKNRHGIDFPFARQHTTYLYGGEITIRILGDFDEEPDFVQASGKGTGQRHFKFVEDYLTELGFDEAGLANRFTAFRSRHTKSVAVTMDPRLRFGEPLLPSGYTARTLWKSIVIEGGIAQTANAYGVPIEEVETAYQYFDHLNAPAL